MPPIELIAKSYGLPFFKATSQSSLKACVKKVLDLKSPAICELIVDPSHVTLPKASVKKKEDGSFTTLPMEDLAPFLDREEFRENLLIKEFEL